MASKKGSTQPRDTVFKRFAKKNEIQKLENEVLEKFVIAALCFITVPAWDKFFKRLFEEIFGDFNTLSSELLYALIITFFASIVAIIFAIFLIMRRR